MTEKLRKYSFEEFQALYTSIQLQKTSSQISNDSIETLDTMTRYFYTSKIENKPESSDDSTQNIEQTILNSAYTLMNIYKKSLEDITKSFGIPYSPLGSQIISNICNDLQLDPQNEIVTQINENYFSKTELSFLLNMPEKSTSEEIKTELTSLLSTYTPKRTLSDADQISSNPEEVDYLKIQLAKERNEKKKLNDQVQIQKSDIEKLKESLKDSEHQIEILKTQNPVDKDDDSQVSMFLQYTTTVDDLTKQIDGQEKEITQLTEENASLKTLVDKQKREIDSLQKQTVMQTPSKQSDDDPFDANIFENTNDDLFDRIAEQTVLISSPFVDDITDIIQDTDRSADDKVVDIVNSLIQDIRKKQETINSLSVQTKVDTTATNNNLYEKVVSAMNNQLVFLSRLSDCENDLKWMKPADDTVSNFRNVLKSEIQRASEFIKENCSGVIEDAYIQTDFFDSLAFDSDPLKFEQEMELYLKTYPEPTTEESRSLMLLLRHLVAALAICTRFATQAKSHTTGLALELQKLKNINKDLESKLHEDTELQEMDKTEMMNEIGAQQELLHRIMNILKTAAMDTVTNEKREIVYQFDEEEGENEMIQVAPNYQIITNSDNEALKAILEAIQQLKEVDEVDEDEYTETLETRYSELLNELDKYKDTQQEIMALHQREQFLTKKVKDLQLQTKGFGEAKMKEIEIKKTDLLEDKESQSEMQPDNESKSEAAAVSNDNESKSVTNSIYKESKSEPTADYNEKSRKKLEKQYSKTIVQLEQDYKEKRKVLKGKLRKSLFEQQTLMNQLSEKDRQIKILETTQEELLVEQKNRTQRMRDNELESQKVIKQLKQQLNDVAMKLAATEMSKRVLEQQLRSLEEKEKRNEIDKKSLQDLLTAEFNSKLEEKLIECRSECNNKHNSIMKEIIQNFKGVFDINPNSPGKSIPNDEKLNDLVLKLSKLAEESVKQSTSESKKLKRNLKELQTLFNVTTVNSINKAAIEFVNNSNKEIELLKKQVERLSLRRDNSGDSQLTSRSVNGKMMTIRDWENWARKLYTWSNNGQSLLLSLSAIMRGVEEAVLEAYGTNKLSKLLDILKIEKVIMLNKQKELNIAFTQQNGNRVVSIRPLIHVFGLIRKLQRLSGTLPSTMSFATPNSKTFVDSSIVEDDDLSLMNNSPDFTVNRPKENQQNEEGNDENSNDANFLKQVLNFDIEEEEEDKDSDEIPKETAVEVVDVTVQEEVQNVVQNEE